MLLISPDVLRLQIDNYFDQIKLHGKFQVGFIEYDAPNPTITGLALFLGFSTTNHFQTYIERPEYTEHIQYALLRIENWYELSLQAGNKNALIGLKKLGDWSGESPSVQVGLNVQQNNASSVPLADRIAMIEKMRSQKKPQDDNVNP